jgi:hypothetical protein
MGLRVKAVARDDGRSGGREKRGLKRCKNRSIRADQGVGPAGSCREMGNFIRIMGNLLKGENTYPFGDAKIIVKIFPMATKSPGLPTPIQIL